MTNVITEKPRPKTTYGKSYNVAFLPPEILAKINSLNLKPCQWNKAVHLSKLLKKNIERNNLSATAGIDLPANYLKKIYGGDYHKWLKQLTGKGLLEIKSWKNKKDEDVVYEQGTKITIDPITFKRHQNGQSKRYGFTPGLLTTNVVPVEYQEKVEKYGEEKTIRLGDEDWGKVTLLQELQNFNFYPERLLAMVEEVSDIKVAEIEIIDSKHPIKYFNQVTLISSDSKIKNISLNYALEIADAEDADLLKDGNKIIICKLEEYKKIKKQNCILNYTRQIKKLELQQFYMRRNTTNFRLDHNLTQITR